MVHREATGNDLHVNARIGSVERQRPVVIRAAANCAEFTVSGGLGYVPLTIRGLSTFQTPRLEMLEADGTWHAVNQSVHGNDFWQTDYDPQSQTWEITFTVPADSPRCDNIANLPLPIGRIPIVARSVSEGGRPGGRCRRDQRDLRDRERSIS